MVNCEMFADDTIPDASNTDPVSVENELQKSINEVSDGCSKNAMVLQPAKRKSMLLATRQKQQLRPLNLSLKADHIEQVHKHRHFGVIIDDEFSGRAVTRYICMQGSAKKTFFLLPQLKHFVDTSKRKLFDHAHISSRLTYASTVWDGWSDIVFQKT